MAISDYLKEIIVSNIMKNFKNVQNEIVKSIRIEIRRLTKYITMKMTAIFLMLIAGLFFALAIIYALIEYAHFSRTFSLLIMAAVFLIIGLVVQPRRERRDENGEE